MILECYGKLSSIVARSCGEIMEEISEYTEIRIGKWINKKTLL